MFALMERFSKFGIVEWTLVIMLAFAVQFSVSKFAAEALYYELVSDVFLR